MSHAENWAVKRTIKLKNVSFCKYDPGEETVIIDVPVQVISLEDAKVLEKLFPNTFRTIDRALAIEALINSVSE